MAFGYTTFAVSGTNLGVNTPVDTMRAISTYLTATLGWTLTEDRSAQAGASSQIILQSNGEDSTASTFYMVMTSGTNSIGIQAATFWNTTTHTVGSGVATPTAATTSTLNAQLDKTHRYWISGDKDAVTFIARRAGAYDGVHFGRIRSLYPASSDPFPIHVIGATLENDIDSLSSTVGDAYSFLDATTALGAGEVDWDPLFTTPLDTNQSPDNIFGSVEKYTCFPLIAGVSDASPVRRAIRGFSINIWVTMGPANASLEQEDTWRASDGKQYQAFFASVNSQRAVVIRRA